MEYKKSAIDLTELAIGVIILGIVVAIGGAVLSTFRDSRLTATDQIQVANESVTGADQGVDLSEPYVISIDHVVNGTNTGVQIDSGNYSTSISSVDTSGIANINVTNLTDPLYNETTWFVSYTRYNTSDPQWNLPDAAAGGLAEYGNWFVILVIVGIAAVILGLIFLTFGGRGGGDSVNF